MQNVQFERVNNIGVLTISRPKALNALNFKTLKEIEDTITDIKMGLEIHCLIITGYGEKAFVAGADISEMKDMDLMEAKEFSTFGNEVFRNIETLDIPVIAAVNGYALGGGCELALSCDIRIASENAIFGQPEVSLGITPGFGGTHRLARTIGMSRAKEMIFTGVAIKADEALKIGLVNKVVSKDDIMKEAMDLAERIVKNSTIAVRNSKNAINKGFINGKNVSLNESELFAQCFESEDRVKAMNAFLDKMKK